MFRNVCFKWNIWKSFVLIVGLCVVIYYFTSVRVRLRLRPGWSVAIRRGLDIVDLDLDDNDDDDDDVDHQGPKWRQVGLQMRDNLNSKNEYKARNGADRNETEYIDVFVVFTKAKSNSVMQEKLSTCVASLVQHSSVNIDLHVIADPDSKIIANSELSKQKLGWEASKVKLKILFHDVREITDAVEEVVSKMQSHFSYKPGAYYSDTLFFLSLALHRAFFQRRAVMVDIDVRFEADVGVLHALFDSFEPAAVIGVAYEQQPVYRHAFHLYRANHSTTSVGEPASSGVPGFNSGVLLLDLNKMRSSTLYNSLLDPGVVDSLVSKYHFKGHLGDQDFFTLISLEHMELFHVLPCGWNRQLCQWWRNHGYESVFDLYYQCNEEIKLYHGNCNTLIPEL